MGIGSEELTEEVDKGKDLLARANNWALERLRSIKPKAAEYNARRLIVGAMKKDLTRGRRLTSWTLVESTISDLEVRDIDNSTGIVKSNIDSITGEKYTTSVRKENDLWVAEEIRDDGSIISQAKVGRDLNYLTLNFKGNRYVKANPDIHQDARFPTATAAVFNLLVSTFKS